LSIEAVPGKRGNGYFFYKDVDFMLRLLLMRHSDAQMSHPRGDSCRSLLPEGRSKAHQQAQALKGVIQPQVIVHSPYVRAEETARIMAETFHVDKIFPSPDLVPYAEDLAILPEVEAFQAGEILLVGHNPHMSRLVSQLNSQGRSISMVTAMIAAIDFDTSPLAGSGRLVFLKRPGQEI